MADPFTPRFVDLVKNYTTTTGTGDFTLGTAVNGFTGFTSALAVGDRFYYSCIGIDKPAEREVGRGTLLSGGKIAREPISGARTSFTTGNKAIALIAAAEWFGGVAGSVAAATSAAQAANAAAASATNALAGVESDIGALEIQVASLNSELDGTALDLAELEATVAAMGGGGGGGSHSVATRAALAAIAGTDGLVRILAEPGREGIFQFSGANLSAEVAADPGQGIYVPPASTPTGASGAWVRKQDGPARPEWFGAVGDGATNDAVALQRWLDRGDDLFLPPKLYRSAAKLILRKTMRLRGLSFGQHSGLAGYGGSANPGSRIIFDAGVGGFDIQPSTTLTDCAAVMAAGAGAWTQEGAFNSVIEDIALIGQGGATATGVYARTLLHARNVRVVGFSGKGWDLSASADAGDGNSEYGNMSNSTLIDCSAEFCGSHGLHIRGRDANTITISQFNGFGNAGWGILQESVIGNTFFKPHFASNVLGAIKIPPFTSSVIISPYIEPDSGLITEINANCVVFGADVTGYNAGGQNPACYGTQTKITEARFIAGRAPEAEASETALVYRYDGLYLQGRGSTKDVVLVNRSGSIAAWIPTNTTDFKVGGTAYANAFQTNGTNTPWPGVADGWGAFHSHIDNGFSLGGYGGTYDTSLRNRSGTVAFGIVANSVNVAGAGNAVFAGTISASNLSGSNTGDETAATIVAKTNGQALTPASVAASGTVSGSNLSGTNTGDETAATIVAKSSGQALTPASIAATGALTSSGGKIGYATGNGGTVTQATSKATGVTLNKSCGEITMNAAALAANTAVTFTLTNSQIEAGDRIIVNHKSGGTFGAYVCDARAAAGSATVMLRNVTAASLSEAVVLGFAVVKAVTT